MKSFPWRGFRGLYLLTTLVLLVVFFVPGSMAAGKTKVLYTFQGGSDGDFPSGALVFDTEGNLFGTTYLGGTGGCSSYQGNGCGTVFELKRGSNGRWQHIVLYNF